MLRIEPIVKFVVVFSVLYGLMLIPWIGWGQTYGDWFRGVGSAFFGSDNGIKVIRFEAHTDTRGNASIDSRLVLGNRARAEADGKMPVIMLGLDSRGMGWIPTALTLALILATPIPWPHRFRAMVWGLVWIHLFILLTIAVYLWDEYPAVGLTTLSPWWMQMADEAKYILVDLYGADFYVPVLIWIAVTFREEDLKRFMTSEKRGRAGVTNPAAGILGRN